MMTPLDPTTFERTPGEIAEEIGAIAPTRRADVVALKAARAKQPPSPDPNEALSGTEDEVALEFSRQHAETLRYVKLWNTWLQWDGAIWRRVKDLWVYHLIRNIARAYSKKHQDKKLARDAATAAIERAARNDRRHDRLPDIWDADKEILSGSLTVNLKTGASYEPQKENYITKSTAVSPERIETPRWTAFLNKVTGSDPELQKYLQRSAGYCLSGITSEHVLFFLYGTGANGKSVFIDTLIGIWADYATVAAMTTFMASHTDQHPTDLAMLQGVRLVVAHETEVGRHWAEARIKAITGGDPITARFMRADFFTYKPHFKLWIVGNHKPSLRTVDEAIRRRIHLVPFTVTIPPEERDKDLFEKLKPEWSGILQWAINGCLEWQKTGLAPPAVVVDATEKYLADEDAFARWIEDECVTGRHHWGTSAQLWGRYKKWSETNNEWTGTQKAFGQELEKRGFEPERSQRVRGYRGIDLAPHLKQPAGNYEPGGD
jgi:P4 family phage/plasmid primase-like protien